jgi:hypothetical protein
MQERGIKKKVLRRDLAGTVRKVEREHGGREGTEEGRV